MISGTSFKQWIVFKSVLKRLKWLGILYTIILFLELPLILWMDLARQKALQGNLLAQINNNSQLFQLMFNPLEHAVNIAVPVIFGLIIFQFLQNDRASTFFHSLPIKRWSLYLQNLLAGLALIWLPIILNSLIIYGVFSAFGITKGEWVNPSVYNSPLGMVSDSAPVIMPLWNIIGCWLLLSLLMTGLFFVFTIFVGMFTGNILLQGALTVIGLFLPLGVYVLVNFNLSKLLYGYSKDINGGIVDWLSPVVSYLSDLNLRYMYQAPSQYLWYFGLTVLLILLSIYLYQQRNVEVAGETLAAGWIRWLFKYGVAFCAALTGGLYFSTFNENSNAVLYLGYCIGAVLGYIVADMIAYKSFHFYKRWRGMLVFGTILAGLFLVVNLDIIGYEKYVPQQNIIKEVSISNLNRDGLPASGGLRDKENIRRIRQLHQAIIQRQKDNMMREVTFIREQSGGYGGAIDPKKQIYRMEISYTLNNGKTIKRSYNINTHQYREFLYPVFSSIEAKKIMFSRLFEINENKIDQINIMNYHLGKNVRIYNSEEVKQVLDALRKDVLLISYEAAVEGQVPALANIEFMSKIDKEKSYSSYSIGLYPEFSNFKTLLQELGRTDELFLDPEEVSEILIKRTGSNRSAKVTDKEDIKTLLQWTNLEDERAFEARQHLPENKSMVEYYGKIVLKKGNPLFVVFENSPYGQQVVRNFVSD